MRTAVLIAAVLALLAGPALAQTHTACGNGDFESGFDAREWSGGNGVVLRNGDPHFASFAAGLIPGQSGGLLNSKSSHQTWVDATERDPVVGISRVAPGGSTHAVRIGNSVCDARADMLAKTFVVGAAQRVIRFSYAVVLQDGGHRPVEQSSFWVRVLDASGTPIGGAVRLVGDRDKLVAGDSSALVKKPGTNVYYRDWTRASIDLSRFIGQTVTVQFITEDCTEGGHYAYAYVDDFCDTGCGAALDVELPDCEKGDVRVNYTLPVVAEMTGSVVLRLDVLRDGEVVTVLSSPPLTSGTSYDFPIEPPIAALGGFDLIATGTFTVGEAVCEVRSVGSAPDGIAPGRNNDFSAIVNGDFESGNVGFSSAFIPATVPETVLPGQYAVLTAAEAAAVACTWRAVSFACDAEGRFLVVNGDTGKGSGSKKVWSQTVSVIGGADYRFIANFRGLPNCGFDVSPEVELRFSSTSPDFARAMIKAGSCFDPAFDHCSEPCSNSCSDPCLWQTESRDIHIPPGVTTLTCEIWLDETEPGDGNDLAIDGISLCRITP